MTFTIPPASTLNRITSELPSHLKCATEEIEKAKIGREVNCLYTVDTNLCRPWGYNIFRDDEGTPLLDLFSPHSASWWCMGRAATRDEVVASIKTLMPVLEQACDKEQLVEHRNAAHTLLQNRFIEMQKFLPEAPLIIVP